MQITTFGGGCKQTLWVFIFYLVVLTAPTTKGPSAPHEKHKHSGILNQKTEVRHSPSWADTCSGHSASFLSAFAKMCVRGGAPRSVRNPTLCTRHSVLGAHVYRLLAGLAPFPGPWDTELYRCILCICLQETRLGCLPVCPSTNSADSNISVSTTLHACAISVGYIYIYILFSM